MRNVLWIDAVKVVDSSRAPALTSRHGEEIPVVFINGRKAVKLRVGEAELRARLARGGAS